MLFRSYEYACHEGNYSLRFQLSANRGREKQQAELAALQASWDEKQAAWMENHKAALTRAQETLQEKLSVMETAFLDRRHVLEEDFRSRQADLEKRAAQAEAEEDNKAWASGSAAVQVLTYHKAKGLEWPVVVCWDLDGEPRERWFSVRVLGNETSPLSLERPLAERRIALWANPFGPKSARNPLLDKLKASAAGQQEIRHSRNEDLRLLYVGITRARELLDRAGLDAQRRPETLTIAEMARLSDLAADPGAA